MQLVLHARLKPSDEIDSVSILVHRSETPTVLSELLDAIAEETQQGKDRELAYKTRVAVLEAEIVRLGGTVP